MKTTEVFVEQVLIGLLVILNVGLIASPDIVGQLRKLDIQTGAAVVGAAYLVGIIFDRFADTLLEDIERHNRLRFALNSSKGRRADKNRSSTEKSKSTTEENKSIDENGSIVEDLFPEGDYRMKLLENGEAVTYANYLRTRIRLSRAMAVLTPGLCIAFLLSVTKERISRTEWISAITVMGVVYGGALVAQLIRGRKTEDGTVWYKPPRTDKFDKVERYKERIKKGRVILALIEPSFWALALLMSLALTLSLRAGRRLFLIVPFVSIVLTLLTGWTWLRIHFTFMAFLRDFSGTKKDS